MKALLIGRHAGQIPDVEIVEQQAITWAATSDEVLVQIDSLSEHARNLGVEAIVFQNMPGQLIATFVKWISFMRGLHYGVIVSKLGERPAGVVHTFPVSDDIEEAIMAATQNAKLESKKNAYGDWYLELTVDPPMKYEFSHIEWF